jgi:hypothetical protein
MNKIEFRGFKLYNPFQHCLRLILYKFTAQNFLLHKHSQSYTAELFKNIT